MDSGIRKTSARKTSQTVARADPFINGEKKTPSIFFVTILRMAFFNRSICFDDKISCGRLFQSFTVLGKKDKRRYYIWPQISSPDARGVHREYGSIFYE